jgi:hypothetical protein
VEAFFRSLLVISLYPEGDHKRAPRSRFSPLFGEYQRRVMLQIHLRLASRDFAVVTGPGVPRQVLLFVKTVTSSCQARPVRADIFWPTATAVGEPSS